MDYICGSCHKVWPTDSCPECVLPAEPLAESERTERSSPSPVLMPERRGEAPTPRTQAHRVPTEGADPNREALVQTGRQVLRQYVEEGYSVYLVAGIADVGKTECIRAYQQQAFLASFKTVAGRVIPTAPQEIKCYPVEVGGRKVVFLDASGEAFKLLYPALDEARPSELLSAAVDFLRDVGRSLAGIALAVDLQKLWPKGHPSPEGRKQQEIAAWILSLLRWLMFDGREAPGPISFAEQVDKKVRIMRRRLRVPVLVLFSKADEVTGLEVPGQQIGLQRARSSDQQNRVLYPPGEAPFFLAYHRLPILYSALVKHVCHFRFDFIHSLTIDPDTTAVDPTSRPCGVEYSLGWLLDPQWKVPSLPTRYLIQLQQAVDFCTGRFERWRRLPESEELSL